MPFCFDQGLEEKMAGDEGEKEVRNHRPSLKTPPSFGDYPKWKSKVAVIFDYGGVISRITGIFMC